MRKHIRSFTPFLVLVCVAAMVLVSPGVTRGSDHSDATVQRDAGRNDARLTDLFAFTRGDNLVLGLCGDPTIPATATKFVVAPVEQLLFGDAAFYNNQFAHRKREKSGWPAQRFSYQARPYMSVMAKNLWIRSGVI